MCHKLDPMFFADLATMDPADVCARSLATFDPARKAYRVKAIDREYEVDAAAQSIKPVEAGAPPPSVEMGLLVLFYLLKSKDLPIENKWVGEFDIRGGERFFRGPHAFRNNEVADKFGNDIEGFKSACEKIGGVPIQMADAAFRFQVLPRVPVVVLLYRADDEFGASSKLLMDASIDKHLPLDIIFGMGLELLGKIVGKTLWH